MIPLFDVLLSAPFMQHTQFLHNPSRGDVPTEMRRVYSVEIERFKSILNHFHSSFRTDALVPKGMTNPIAQFGLVLFHDTHETDGADVWLVPEEGDQPARRLTSTGDARFLRWREDLIVSALWDGETVSLRRVEHTSGQTEAFAPFADSGNPDDLSAFDVSRDGRLVAIVQLETRGDIWLVVPIDGS